MDLDLAGRVALVTGAARGIGLAEARALAAEGAIIALNDLDRDAAANAATALQAEGWQCEAFAADAADEAAVASMVNAIADRFGRLDILVNNAGIAGRHLGKHLVDTTTESWDAMIHVHLRSTFLCSRAVIPHMRKRKYGRIINTSSMNYTGGGRPGVANYAAAKAGIAGLTRTLAKEIGCFGLTANAIAPGYVDTELLAYMSERKLAIMREQNPVGRLCRPDEVGSLVAFLCSQQAAFINGATVCMDGGRRDFYWGEE